MEPLQGLVDGGRGDDHLLLESTASVRATPGRGALKATRGESLTRRWTRRQPPGATELEAGGKRVQGHVRLVGRHFVPDARSVDHQAHGGEDRTRGGASLSATKPPLCGSAGDEHWMPARISRRASTALATCVITRSIVTGRDRYPSCDDESSLTVMVLARLAMVAARMR
jgi:hypothetical protein